MSSPKADDNDKILGKCGTITDPHVTYIPSDNSIPTTYPADRSGNKIYGYVNMSGNHDTGCRMIPLNGHPQDYSRRLYNSDMNQNPFGWEERGVELYENFGLSEDIFPHNGNYGIIGPDLQNYTTMDGTVTQGTKCNSGTQTNSNMSGHSQGCQNRCITELGRKISLFGQVGFMFYNAFGSVASGASPQGNNLQVPKNFTIPYIEYGTHSNIGYVINYYKQTRTITDDHYDYFGNSGVCIKDANGTQFYFIYGQQPYMISAQGVKSLVPSQIVDWWTSSDDTGLNIYIDIKFFNQDAISPQNMEKQFKQVDQLLVTVRLTVTQT